MSRSLLQVSPSTEVQIAGANTPLVSTASIALPTATRPGPPVIPALMGFVGRHERVGIDRSSTRSMG